MSTYFTGIGTSAGVDETWALRTIVGAAIKRKTAALSTTAGQTIFRPGEKLQVLTMHARIQTYKVYN